MAAWRSKGDMFELVALGQARRLSGNVRLRYIVRRLLMIAVLGLMLAGCATTAGTGTHPCQAAGDPAGTLNGTCADGGSGSSSCATKEETALLLFLSALGGQAQNQAAPCK